jgi:hypothetical protein
MRAHDFLVESKIPAVVYHGTASTNLTNIMKHGIKPKLNRYEYSNRMHGGGFERGLELEPGERRSDLETISTSVNFDNSLEYAKLGGSTGSGSPGVVIAFKPLPSDSFEATGMPGEVIFRNAISPDRLQIVWPKRLVGKERELAQRAEQKKQAGAAKTEQIKTINKQLKTAGSFIRIKSTNANTPRIAIWFMDPTDPVQVGNTNIDDQNFAVFLQRELANPAPNKQRYYGRTNWLNENDIEEMAGEIHGGVRKALMDKGYQYLGSGIDKQAYLEPGTGQVLIVFGYRKGIDDFSPDQRMFINWINYCNKHRDNPHLPKFSGFESFQFQGKNYIQARMEALQEVSEELGYLVGNIEEVTMQVGRGNFDRAIETLAGYAQDSSYEGDATVWYDIKTTIKMLGGKQAAKNLLDTVHTVKKFGKKHGFNIDLHRGNYMQRPNGTIVVNDPFVIWIHGS